MNIEMKMEILLGGVNPEEENKSYYGPNGDKQPVNTYLTGFELRNDMAVALEATALRVGSELQEHILEMITEGEDEGLWRLTDNALSYINPFHRERFGDWKKWRFIDAVIMYAPKGQEHSVMGR